MRTLSFCLFVFLSLPAGAWCAETSPPSSAEVQKLQRVKKALVSIKKVTSLAAYEDAETTYKSGFICDKKRGLVMTTRGPNGYGLTVATFEITLPGGQRVEARSLYRDPFYDLEVLIFDPKEAFGDLEEITAFKREPDLDEKVYMVRQNAGQEIVQKGTITNLYETPGVMPQQLLRISLNTPGGDFGALVLTKDLKCAGMVVGRGQTFVHALIPACMSDVLRGLQTKNKAEREEALWRTKAFLDDRIDSASLSDAAKHLAFPQEKLKEFVKAYPQALAHGLIVAEITENKIWRDDCIQAGDVLWKIDGQLIGPSLYAFQRAFKKEKEAHVTVIRRGKEVTFKVSGDDTPYRGFSWMKIFGGAVFYRPDVMIRRLLGADYGVLMISKIRPGSAFDDVFPACPTRGVPTYFIQVNKINRMPLVQEGLDEHTLRIIMCEPQATVTFQDLGCSLSPAGVLATKRHERISYVDLTAMTDMPQRLNWDEDNLHWEIKPIPLPSKKCLMELRSRLTEKGPD